MCETFVSFVRLIIVFRDSGGGGGGGNDGDVVVVPFIDGSAINYRANYIVL